MAKPSGNRRVRPTDIKALVRAIEADGGMVIKRRKHYLARTPGGTSIFFAQTPSDHRSCLNCWGLWRRTLEKERDLS